MAGKNCRKEKSQKALRNNRAEMLFGLNLDLRPFYLLVLFLILFLSPLMRGLFFPEDLLPMCILAGASFIFCAFDMVLRKDIFVPRSALDWAVIAYFLAWALSLVGAVHIGSAIREVMEAAACLFIYVCSLRAARGERELDNLLKVCYIAGLAVAAVGVLAAGGVFPFPGAYESGRLISTFQYPNSLAGYLVLLSAIGLSLSVKRERLFSKVFYACGNFLMILVILGTQSRGGWLVYPLAVGGVIALLPAAYRWRAAYHLVIPLGCALFAGRGFFSLLRSGEGLRALEHIAWGAGVAIALQIAYHFLAQWLNRDEFTDATRRLAAAGGIGYIMLVIAFYVYSSAGALPVTAASIAPAEVVRRAEQISGYEVNFRNRLEFSRDALRIVKDHPIFGLGGGGWNALYHRYQSSLYWTTETHNHFFQTWVEAGTIGFLAFLSIWIGFIATVVRFLRGNERDGLQASVAGAFAGALALGVHSAFDFDLSLPAVSFLLFALLGGVRGAASAAVAAVPVEGPMNGSGTSGKVGLCPASPPWLVGAAVVGLAAGLALIIPARNFYAAGTVGAMGARALFNKDLKTAERCYAEAMRLDPFTASYAADLAQVYAAEALQDKDAIKHYRAIRLARKAAELEPYNARLRAVLVNVYLELDEPLLAAKEADALLEANPMLASSYELVAAARLAAARFYLRHGKRDLAMPLLKPLDGLISEMRSKKLEPAPRFRLYQGAIDAVAGRFAAAGEHLREAERDGKTSAEAKAWLALTLKLGGDLVASERLVAEIKKEHPDSYKIYEDLRKESLSWPSSL